MIAAGSLFTSCVNYEEPVGVQDLREAKASYLDALSALRGADATVREAEAAYKQAEAKLKEAEAKVKEAEAKKQEIANDKERALADEAIAAAKERAEIAAEAHKQAMAKYAQALEELQKQIAAESLGLTAAEKKAVQDAINYYTTALGLYNTAAGEVAKAEQDLYDAENDFNGMTEDEYSATLEYQKAYYQQYVDLYQSYKDALTEDADVNEWKDNLSQLANANAASYYQYEKNLANIEILKATELKPAQIKAAEAWTEWTKANKKPATAAKKAIKGGWALPKYPSTLNAFVNTLNYYIGVIDDGVNVVKVVNDSIKFTENATFDKVLPVINGVENDPNEFKAMGVKGMVELIESKDILKADDSIKEEAEEAFNYADSIYKADLEILKAGRVAYLTADTNITNAIADTVKKVDALKAEEDTLKSAQDAFTAAKEADSTNFAAVKDAVAKVIAEVKDFAGSDYIYSVKDSAALAKALLDLEAAKVAAGFVPDTLGLRVKKESATGVAYTDTLSVAVAELEAIDFAQTIVKVEESEGTLKFWATNNFQNAGTEAPYNKVPYLLKYTCVAATGEGTTDDPDEIKDILVAHPLAVRSIASNYKSDPFSMLVNALLDEAADFQWDELQVLQLAPAATVKYPNTLALTDFGFKVAGYPSAFYTNQYGFVVSTAENHGGNWYGFHSAEYKAAEEAQTKANEDVDSAEDALEDSKVAVYEAEAASINAFDVIFNRFFEENWHTAYTVEQYKAVASWDAFDANLKAKVEDIELYASKLAEGSVYDINGEVVFAYSETMLDNIAILMKQFNQQFNDADGLRAFVYGATGNSEYADLAKATYDFNLAKSYKDAVEIFDVLKTVVSEAETLANDSKAAYEKANKDLDDWNVKAYGKKSGYTEYDFTKSPLDQAENLSKIGGEQKAIYETYLKELVDEINTITKENNTLYTINQESASLYNTLSEIYANALSAYEDTGSATSFAVAYKNAVAVYTNAINTYQGYIDVAKAALAKLAAGVDPKQVAVEGAQRALEAAQAKLAAAEEVLAIAKAQYDAVIAKYVK